MDEWMDADFGTDFGGELYRQHLEGTVLYRQKRQFKKEEDPSQLTARQNQSLQQYGLKMEEGSRKTGSKKKKKEKYDAGSDARQWIPEACSHIHVTIFRFRY